MPERFNGDSAARSAKSWPPVSLSPRCGPIHDRDVDVHIGMISVFLTSKALVTSFSAISMWFFSLICLAHKRKILFLSNKAKSNFNPFSPHMSKTSPFEELVPMKKVRQNFSFGSGCTVPIFWNPRSRAWWIIDRWSPSSTVTPSMSWRPRAPS